MDGRSLPGSRPRRCPRAEFIAELTGEYLQGYINAEMYGRAIGSGYHIWDAAVYVYNARGELMVYPKQGELENINALLSAYLPDVMEAMPCIPLIATTKG